MELVRPLHLKYLLMNTTNINNVERCYFSNKVTLEHRNFEQRRNRLGLGLEYWSTAFFLFPKSSSKQVKHKARRARERSIYTNEEREESSEQSEMIGLNFNFWANVK